MRGLLFGAHYELVTGEGASCPRLRHQGYRGPAWETPAVEKLCRAVSQWTGRGRSTHILKPTAPPLLSSGSKETPSSSVPYLRSLCKLQHKTNLAVKVLMAGVKNKTSRVTANLQQSRGLFPTERNGVECFRPTAPVQAAWCVAPTASVVLLGHPERAWQGVGAGVGGGQRHTWKE